MKKTYENGLAWGVNAELPGTEIVSHGGGTGGYESFVGFDKVRRHGVVVLFNGRRVIDVDDLGNFLLKSEWGPDVGQWKSRPAAKFPSCSSGMTQSS